VFLKYMNANFRTVEVIEGNTTPPMWVGGVTFIYIANAAAIHDNVPTIHGRC
jgi:hypothetical protein